MRRRLLFIVGGLVLVGVVGQFVLSYEKRSEWTADVAPAVRTAPDHWTSGDKDAIGTAHSTASPVWFTAMHGTLADVLYPTVDADNLRQFGFLVTDGTSWFFDASQQGVASARVTDPRALTYELRVDDTVHHFSLVTEIATSPDGPVVLVRTHLTGDTSRLHVYAYLVPHLAGSGNAQTAFFEGKRGYVSRGKTWLAVVADAIGDRTAGYLGHGDGYDQLHNHALTNRYRQAGPGHVTLTWELPQGQTWTSELAFGTTRQAADVALDAAMARGPQALFDAYRNGWRDYAAALKAPADTVLPLFYYSAEVIKMAEDKQHPGAIVASLALPWGDTATDDAVDVGYRKVWPRDLYHAAQGLLAAGDESTAADVARFMGRMQRADGSMPQNTDLLAVPVWTGQQLDETADAILLAVRIYRVLNAGEGPDITRAADYIVRTGPQTQQERWEEAGGYSPATMAAEIAALNAAVAWSSKTGVAADRAAVWASTARSWNVSLESTTFVTGGPLGAGYYLRISGDGKPSASELVDLANQGGVWDQREIVDPSFLELVRLGVRPPNDARVTATLAVVDAASSGQARGMTMWYRYPHDGYGEKNEGSAPPGRGHLWPLLTGERGVYEALRGGDPGPYVGALSSLAGSDQLLGEQVWEDTGLPSGSARPLVWAHAEYIILAKAAATGVVDDSPSTWVI